MKKMLIISLFCLCVSNFALAWTPLRFCVLPEIAIPKTSNVYGLNFGIIDGEAIPTQIIAGVDFAAIGSKAGVDGLQISLVNMTQNSAGVQLAVGVNVAEHFDGFQLALFNGALKNSGFFQFGVFNKSSESTGFQLGLFNIMDNGFLPFFPLFNFPISSKPVW